MKRTFMAAAAFVLVFAVVYVAVCYLIPGWRIKLEAPPLIYFLESIRSMVLIKAVIAGAAGLAAAGLVLAKKRI